MPAAVLCDGAQPDDPQQVLAAAVEAYMAVEQSGRVIGWNPAAEAAFGYTRLQTCGAGWTS